MATEARAAIAACMAAAKGRSPIVSVVAVVAHSLVGWRGKGIN